MVLYVQGHQNRMTGIRASQKEKLSRLLNRTCGSGCITVAKIHEVKRDYFSDFFFFNLHELTEMVLPKVLQNFKGLTCTIWPRELNTKL